MFRMCSYVLMFLCSYVLMFLQQCWFRRSESSLFVSKIFNFMAIHLTCKHDNAIQKDEQRRNRGEPPNNDWSRTQDLTSITNISLVRTLIQEQYLTSIIADKCTKTQSKAIICEIESFADFQEIRY